MVHLRSSAADTCLLRPGRSVLITSASGGVGQFVCQPARHGGAARVVGWAWCASWRMPRRHGRPRRRRWASARITLERRASALTASSLVRPAARAHPAFCPIFIPVAVRERTSRFMRRRIAVRRRRSTALALRGHDRPQQATTAPQAAFQDMPARLASVHWLSALMDSAHPPRSRQAG